MAGDWALEVVCACCELPVDPVHRVSVAMTSTNFAMVFHAECMERMHSRAVELTPDVRQWVLASVQEAMENEG